MWHFDVKYYVSVVFDVLVLMLVLGVAACGLRFAACSSRFAACGLWFVPRMARGGPGPNISARGSKAPEARCLNCIFLNSFFLQVGYLQMNCL